MCLHLASSLVIGFFDLTLIMSGQNEIEGITTLSYEGDTKMQRKCFEHSISLRNLFFAEVTLCCKVLARR